MVKSSFVNVAFLLIVMLSWVTLTNAQITAFSYQGSLQNNGAPANGSYDFAFQLFDALSGGNQIGVIQPRNNIQVVNGLFSVSLDFGAQFPGANRFLDILVRPSGPGSYTALLPRQQISSSPYSIKTISADTATNAANLNNQPASFYQNAANLNAGTLPDARIGSNFARRDASNTFTGQNIFTSNSNQYVGDGFEITNINAANVLFGTLPDSRLSANTPRLNATNSFTGQNNFAGNVGIGTTSPGEKVEISGQDTTLRVRNTNDSGGGFMLDTFSTLQLGLYNPTGTAWGSIPANTKRSLFGMQNSGRVGTLTNTTGSPVWRNTIDDGSGNATFAGSIDAANLTAIKSSYTFTDSRGNARGTVAGGNFVILDTVSFTPTANGVLLLFAEATVLVDATAIIGGQGAAELKIDENTPGNSGLRTNTRFATRSGNHDGTNLTITWSTPVTAGETRTFQTSLYAYRPYGSGSLPSVHYWTSSLRGIFIPRSLP